VQAGPAAKAAAAAAASQAAARTAATPQTMAAAAAPKATAATNATKLDRVIAVLGDLGLDVGDIGRAVSPPATQPVIVNTPKDNTPLYLIGGGLLLALLIWKGGKI